MPKSGVITKSNNSVRPYLRTLLCVACAGILVVGPVQAERGNNRQGGGREAVVQKREGQGDKGAARAAQNAESRYGGKALKVSPQGNAYGVRLLLPDGTVKNVTVDSGD